jgi:hypothetical protein
MMLAKFFAQAMLVALGVALATNGDAQPSQPTSPAPTPEAGARQEAEARVEPVLEPKAIDLLKAMSARLAGARTMTFTAISTYENPTHIGPPLAYTTISEVTLQRPDKLRVITPGDGPASEFYYDGKTMMAYVPADNLVAVADAPATIDGALKAAYDSAAIYFPFTDVIVADPYQDIADRLEHAFVIGQSRVVGGTTTDMVAIVSDRVFGQLWIGADDKLPRMLRAVYADDPSRLRHQVEFSNWRLDGQIPADAFASSRAASAPRIPFARPDPKPPMGAGAAPEGQPSTTK